jgi:hypothetical protein
MDAGRCVMGHPERVTRLPPAISRKPAETTCHERRFGLSSPMLTRGVRHPGEDGDGGPALSPGRPQAPLDDCWSVPGTWLTRALLRPSASPCSRSLGRRVPLGQAPRVVAATGRSRGGRSTLDLPRGQSKRIFKTAMAVASRHAAGAHSNRACVAGPAELRLARGLPRVGL